MLYDFLTSNEFRRQIEAIVEGFTQMKSDLETEKRSTQGIWKKEKNKLKRYYWIQPTCIVPLKELLETLCRLWLYWNFHLITAIIYSMYVFTYLSNSQIHKDHEKYAKKKYSKGRKIFPQPRTVWIHTSQYLILFPEPWNVWIVDGWMAGWMYGWVDDGWII